MPLTGCQNSGVITSFSSLQLGQQHIFGVSGGLITFKKIKDIFMHKKQLCRQKLWNVWVQRIPLITHTHTNRFSIADFWTKEGEGVGMERGWTAGSHGHCPSMTSSCTNLPVLWIMPGCSKTSHSDYDLFWLLFQTPTASAGDHKLPQLTPKLLV